VRHATVEHDDGVGRHHQVGVAGNAAARLAQQQLAEAVASIAGAIVFSRFPEFSRLAGTRSSRELDGLFLSTSGISMALCFLGALGVGLYQYAYTDVTAAGESLPSPLATVVSSRRS
jgi:hypothetical protein